MTTGIISNSNCCFFTSVDMWKNKNHCGMHKSKHPNISTVDAIGTQIFWGAVKSLDFNMMILDDFFVKTTHYIMCAKKISHNKVGRSFRTFQFCHVLSGFAKLYSYTVEGRFSCLVMDSWRWVEWVPWTTWATWEVDLTSCDFKLWRKWSDLDRMWFFTFNPTIELSAIHSESISTQCLVWSGAENAWSEEPKRRTPTMLPFRAVACFVPLSYMGCGFRDVSMAHLVGATHVHMRWLTIFLIWLWLVWKCWPPLFWQAIGTMIWTDKSLPSLPAWAGLKFRTCCTSLLVNRRKPHLAPRPGGTTCLCPQNSWISLSVVRFVMILGLITPVFLRFLLGLRLALWVTLGLCQTPWLGMCIVPLALIIAGFGGKLRMPLFSIRFGTI